MTSEILGQERLEGEPVEKEKLLGQTVKVQDYVALKSKVASGYYPLIQAKWDNRIITLLMNSFTLKQLKQIGRNKFPIKLRVAKKIGSSGKPWWRFEL